jgi:voltage-gated potassium channel
MTKLINFIGLAGVDEDENPIAVRWGSYFNIVMIGMLVWLALLWYYEFKNLLSVEEAWFGHFVIWLFFFMETLVLSLLVNDKKSYLKRNWLNVLIVITCLPLLLYGVGAKFAVLRVLRVLFILGLIIPWMNSTYGFLTDNRLDTSLLAAFIILLIFSVLIVEIDPNIHTLRAGFWWAWVTITTVGYGDIVPVSTVGRLFGGILILIGMGLFSVITANFAALLIRNKAKKETKQMGIYWSRNFKQLEKIELQQRAIAQQLSELSLRISELEKKPPPKSKQ